MRKIGLLWGLVAIVAILALTATAASAHEFVASKAGTVKGKNVGNVTFKAGTRSFHCTEATSNETIGKAGAFKVGKGKATFAGCSGSGATVLVPTIEYELSAEGWVSLLKAATIEVPAGECSVTAEPTGNKELKSIVFTNKEGKLEVESKITGASYTSSGGECGSSGTNGEFSGTSLIELEGGTLEWK